MILPSIEPAALVGDGGADGATAFGVGKAGERAGPCNVAVACRVQTIAALAETPFAAVVRLAQREVIGGNIVLASWKALFGHGEPVHQRKPGTRAQVSVLTIETSAVSVGILVGAAWR
jgi:hypothetical protein